jgi:Concanavalin A-like lectin/glucanases superfamily
VYIGYQADAVPGKFDGSIDDVRIYNRALSADEIKRLYNMGR